MTWLQLRPQLVIFLFPVPIWYHSHVGGRAVIIIDMQKRIIYYAVYDIID